jgi:hypothetical protein
VTPDLTRRALMGQAAGAAAVLAGWPGAAVAGAAATTTPRRPVPLPTGAQLRADIQRMVDMGPRYTGTAGHGAFVDWLERELDAAGVVMLPRDAEPLTIWEATGYGLELLEGAAKGPVRVSGYYPRSQETGPGGVTGRLVDAGIPPLPSLNLDTDLATSLPAALAAYPAAITSWVQSLGGRLGASAQGSVMLVDVPLPLPLTAAAFLPLATHLQWSGHSVLDWAAIDYKRPWLLPGVVGVPLAPFKVLGAAAVVFILDVPYAALNGNYLPFEAGFEPIPALYVDRDTGAELRRAAATAPRARLTLQATRRQGTAPSLIGYLPGTSKADEAIIVDTHTDGEGFVEENGGVAMVHLARHFGSRPAAERLRRTLVFSLWPGHMASGMKQLEGVIEKHEDIVRSAAAAITMEHLGCSEWIETADKGYHATGEAELLGIWTTQGKVFDIVKAQTVKHDVPRAALLRPPVQFGVGGAFQNAGVPQVGYLAGPYYLLRDSKDGDMDKFDAALAEKQVAWTADILRDLDAADAAELAQGDITLGTKSKGPKATFPPRPAYSLGVRLRAIRRGAVDATGALHGAVTVSRTGNVRVHATLLTGGRRVTLADRLLKLHRTGETAFTLRLSRRARRALTAAGPGAVVVLSARARADGGLVVKQARRRTT